MYAVRSLLTLVPVDQRLETVHEESLERCEKEFHTHHPTTPQPQHSSLESSWTEYESQSSAKPPTRNGVSPSETASQLTEGTLRALRDLALDEAVQLQGSLRFWTSRWERPLLSWLEAGPIGRWILVDCCGSFFGVLTSLTLVF